VTRRRKHQNRSGKHHQSCPAMPRPCLDDQRPCCLRQNAGRRNEHAALCRSAGPLPARRRGNSKAAPVTVPVSRLALHRPVRAPSLVFGAVAPAMLPRYDHPVRGHPVTARTCLRAGLLPRHQRPDPRPVPWQPVVRAWAAPRVARGRGRAGRCGRSWRPVPATALPNRARRPRRSCRPR